MTYFVLRALLVRSLEFSHVPWASASYQRRGRDTDINLVATKVTTAATNRETTRGTIHTLNLCAGQQGTIFLDMHRARLDKVIPSTDSDQRANARCSTMIRIKWHGHRRIGGVCALTKKTEANEKVCDRCCNVCMSQVNYLAVGLFRSLEEINRIEPSCSFDPIVTLPRSNDVFHNALTVSHEEYFTADSSVPRDD